jgi:AcrR family transcriptional regulator
MGAVEDAATQIADALEQGRMGRAELTARGLGAFMGRTTGHVYHRFGSLDGLLFAVVEVGYQRLAARLYAAFAERSSLRDLAQAFVEFGVDCPLLYGLMFEHPFDWKALRARGAFATTPPSLKLWQEFVAGLARFGVREPDVAARLMVAGLHGLVSLVLSGRANVGAIEKTDREVALSSARRLADLISADVTSQVSKENLHEPARAAAEAQERHAKQSPGQGRAVGKPGKPRRRSQ